MKAIDLSNPPEGATHYHTQDPANPFRKIVNGVPFAYAGGEWHVIGLHARQYWKPLPITAQSIDFSQMPEGTTHVCIKSLSLWRKAVNGVAFAWDGERWSVTGVTSETKWQPVASLQTRKGGPTNWLKTPVKAVKVIAGSRKARQVTLDGHTTLTELVGQGYRYWPRRIYGPECPPQLKDLDNPKPAQWDGEGLPPVGVDCEVLWSSMTQEYVTCRVVGHDEGSAVYRLTSGERKGGYETGRDETYPIQGDPDGGLPNFRPIKTAEQLAAEQREAVVGRIRQVVADKLSVSGDGVRAMAKALYDAGLRFPEEK